MDVESLFTNVPIDPTIDIIIQHCYHHPNLTPPEINQDTLKKLLQLCTKSSPFKAPDGATYLQIEGVAMGTPLGPTFANFYVGNLEQQVIPHCINKPILYCRYIDDIFLIVSDQNHILELKQSFESRSVLKFTIENSINNKLPFLDVHIENLNNSLKTTVYRKPTNTGTCLNFNSQCCDRYKQSVISSYLNRAYKITTNWQDFHVELNHIKQMLVNNNYPNFTVDSAINKFINQKMLNSSNEDSKTAIPIFYQSQFHNNFKIEERVIKEIIYNNVKCISPEHKLQLIIYYRNRKTCNMVMKNNPAPPKLPLQQTNLIYKFKCPLNHSQITDNNSSHEYIGVTSTTLSRRLTMHAQSGSIKAHFNSHHNCNPTRAQLTENTQIISKNPDRNRLLIYESLFILHHSPSINRQYDNFTQILKLNAHRNHIYNHRAGSTGSAHSHATPNVATTVANPPQSPTSDNHRAGSTGTAHSRALPLVATTVVNPPQSPTSDNNLPRDNINQISNSPINNSNINISNNHLISPNINNRINMLLHSIRSPIHSPAVLRHRYMTRANQRTHT